MASDVGSGDRIFQQIEAKADYWPPAIYDLLTFGHNLETDTDPASGSFIPLTSTVRRQDALPFVVGILPPSSNVTGQLLDRSATVSSVTETSPASPAETLTAPQPPAGGEKTTAGPGKGDLGDGFWDRYVEMCNRLGVDPHDLAAVLTSESGFNPAARNPSGASGLCQIMPYNCNALGMTPDEWDGYTSLKGTEQLYWVERFYGRRVRGYTGGQLYRHTFGGYNNPDGSLYSTKNNARNWNAANGKDPNDLSNWKNIDFQDRAVKQNAFAEDKENGAIRQSDLDRYVAKYQAAYAVAIDAAMRRVGDSGGVPPPRPGTPGNTAPNEDWPKDGSSAAGKAAKESGKTADQDLNKTDLGKDFQTAQKAMIIRTQQALDAMRNMPPLRMMVNPSSFRVSSEKIVADGNRSRVGPIVEHWGEQQDKIEGSGKVAAFFVADALNAYGPGLTRVSRNFSASYQNFLALWQLYRNNAALWVQDDFGGTPDTKYGFYQYLSVLGSMYLYYDGVLYLGSFDNFSSTEDAGTPFGLEYSFSFTVRAWFLLDRDQRVIDSWSAQQAGGTPVTTGATDVQTPPPSPELLAQRDNSLGNGFRDTRNDDPLFINGTLRNRTPITVPTVDDPTQDPFSADNLTLRR